MNRRDFLQSLGILLAASQLPAVLPSVEAAPVINWDDWHRIGLKSGPSGVMALLDGADVTRHPEILKRIGQIVQVNHETGAVSFSAAAHMEPGSKSFLTMFPSDLDSANEVKIECSYKTDNLGDISIWHEGTIKYLSWDDGRPGTVFASDQRDAVRIEAIRPDPKYKPEIDWQPSGSYLNYLEETKELQ